MKMIMMMRNRPKITIKWKNKLKIKIIQKSICLSKQEQRTSLIGKKYKNTLHKKGRLSIKSLNKLTVGLKKAKK